jgi:hypothetical protein
VPLATHTAWSAVLLNTVGVVTLSKESATSSGTAAYALGPLLTIIAMNPETGMHEPSAVDTRLDEITNLPPGWNAEGNARAVTNQAVQATRQLLPRVSVGRSPWIGPTPDGGLQLIWIVGGRELQLDISPAGDRFVMFHDDDDEPLEGGITDMETLPVLIRATLLRG